MVEFAPPPILLVRLLLW